MALTKMPGGNQLGGPMESTQSMSPLALADWGITCCIVNLSKNCSVSPLKQSLNEKYIVLSVKYLKIVILAWDGKGHWL